MIEVDYGGKIAHLIFFFYTLRIRMALLSMMRTGSLFYILMELDTYLKTWQ